MFFLESINTFDWLTILISSFVGALISWLISKIVLLFKPTHLKPFISTRRIKENSFSPFSNDGIEVHVDYKGFYCREGLSVMQFDLLNRGGKSISFDKDFYGPLLIKSESFKILDAKVLNPGSINSEVSINDEGSVCVKWGLWKKGESIRIQLIGQPSSQIESEDPGFLSFYDSLRYNLRSDCIDSIVVDRPSLRNSIVVLFFIALFSFGVLYFFVARDSSVHYYTFDISGETVSGFLEYNKANDSFMICSRDSLYSRDRIFSFERHPEIIVSNTISEGMLFLIICVAMFFMTSIIAVGDYLIESYKDKNKMF